MAIRLLLLHGGGHAGVDRSAPCSSSHPSCASGFLADFISEPVLSGFKAGIGVVIVLDQVPKLLGVHFPKGTFLQNLLALFQSLPDTSAATLAVGLVMIACCSA